MVEVAFAQDPVEAEMVQGLLDGAGIRSVLRSSGLTGRQAGFGRLYAGLGGGAQRVMVWTSEADAARDLLAATLIGDDEEPWPGISADG